MKVIETKKLCNKTWKSGNKELRAAIKKEQGFCFKCGSYFFGSYILQKHIKFYAQIPPQEERLLISATQSASLVRLKFKKSLRKVLAVIKHLSVPRRGRKCLRFLCVEDGGGRGDCLSFPGRKTPVWRAEPRTPGVKGSPHKIQGRTYERNLYTF